MFKRLATIKIGVLEFVYKFLLVLFVIMPLCMGVCFWIGVQADAALNIHLLKFIMPFIGSAVGFFFTALLIQAGHKREVPPPRRNQPNHIQTDWSAGMSKRRK